MPHSSRRVAVVLSTDMACFREILRGVNAFKTSPGDWTLELYSPAEDFAAKIRAARPDGLILSSVNDQRESVEAVETVHRRAVGVAATFREPELVDLPQV